MQFDPGLEYCKQRNNGAQQALVNGSAHNGPLDRVSNVAPSTSPPVVGKVGQAGRQ